MEANMVSANQNQNQTCVKNIQVGRPRLSVDFALILHLREVCNLGWSRVVREYSRKTGHYVSKETCKRRHMEVKTKEATTKHRFE